VGVVFPRCRFDRASDIPVASPSSRLRSRPFGCARFTRSTPRRVGEKGVARGSDEEEAAKTAVTIEP
jgi:hypothetical protein